MPVLFGLRRPVSFLSQLRADRVLRWVAQWQLLGTGAFASQINSCNIVIRTRAELTQPDIQVFANPVRLDAQIWFPGIRNRPEDQITADVILLHPHSRGRVTLRSADPGDQPAITLNNFAEPADLRTARDGIRLVRRIYRGGSQAMLTGREVLPGQHLTTDAELDAHIREHAGITQHPVGTCAMGRGGLSVVDPQLRVHGIERLRVVDASIMPTIPGGNTNVPTIMIAEKASDLILGLPPLVSNA